jgi:polyisoprenoid-binding protein YceI
MSKLVTAIAVLALSVPAVASTWKSDPAHSSATFGAKHMMVTNVRGTLGPITSTIQLDDKDVTKSKVEATIDASKLNSGIEKRDEHLKSPDFLDVAKFPSVVFKSKKIEKAGDKYKVTGDLTIKDKTKEVVLDTVISPEVINPFSKAATRGVSATGTINREDFGLTWNMPMGDGFLVSKEVKIEIEVEFVKDDAAKAAPMKAPPAKK